MASEASRAVLPGCQYWVLENNPAGGYECGNAAVAIWHFTAGEDHPDEQMRVCEKHDRMVEERLNAAEEPE